MRINAIGVTTFGNKQQLIKKSANLALGAGLATAALATDTFVKGVSKPNEAVKEEVIKGNDDGWNPCDEPCDDLCNAACDD